ncbi:MAG: DUF4899 domain-containing protein [bacterium]
MGKKRDIERIMAETGCTEEQATLVLEYAGGDVDEAIKTIVSSEKFIYVIKGKFISNVTKLRGLFVVFANVKTEAIERCAFLATDDQSFYLIDLDMKWSEFEESLYIRKFSKGVIQSASQDMQRALEHSLQGDQFKEKFFRSLRDVDKDLTRNMLTDTLRTVSSVGGDVDVTINIEQIDLYQFKGVSEPGEEKGEEGGKEKEGAPEEAPVTTVKTKLIVDPINGLPLSQLDRGDAVYLALIDDGDVNEVAGYVSLNPATREVLNPVRIDNISSTDAGQVLVRTVLVPGIFGTATLRSMDVKIKVGPRRGDVEGDRRKISSRQQEGEGGDTSIVIIIGAAVLILILIFIIFLVTS